MLLGALVARSSDSISQLTVRKIFENSRRAIGNSKIRNRSEFSDYCQKNCQ